jgi:hypothetical protein
VLKFSENVQGLTSPAHIQAPCGSLIARSGEGKTRAVRRALSRYAQVIHHDTMKNPLLPAKQVVYLHLECPADRTIPSLVSEFVSKLAKAIGEDIPRPRGNRSQLVGYLAELCETYWIGLVVLDECQHALKKGEPAAELMNFLVAMSNTLAVPILYVGTPAALQVIGRQLRQARRMLGHGWAGLAPGDPEWTDLVDQIWSYQFTRTITPLDDDLRQVIYDYTQGIPSFLVTLYLLVQRMVISAGLPDERLTSGHFDIVYEQYFEPVRPMLEALKSGKKDRIRYFEDLEGSDEIEQWFALMETFRGELEMKAQAKLTRAHKTALRAMIKSSTAELGAAVRRKLDEAMAGNSLPKLLLTVKQHGFDPVALLKLAARKAGNN